MRNDYLINVDRCEFIKSGSHWFRKNIRALFALLSQIPPTPTGTVQSRDHINADEG